MNERTKEFIQMADLCAAGLMASGATEEEIQTRSKVVLVNLVRADEREACAKMVEPLDESLADEIRARGDVHASDMSEKHVQISDKDRHEWVGLTDEEVADYWVAAFNENGLYVQTFASLIEAKLKEKNT